MTYLITFSCYGSHIHGDPQGSVDRSHNHYGGPLVAPNPSRREAEVQLMDQCAYQLDDARRQLVLEAILERSRERAWHVLAAHVRSNHVHVVVEGDEAPELMMTQFKSAASRHLNELGLDDSTTKRWARHGSTKRLWDRDSVLKAIGYVIDGQGEAMSRFEADRSCRSRL